MHTPILRAVIVLVLWTFLMLAWALAARIHIILRDRLAYDPERPTSEFMDRVPARVRWKADNYNHLHEQPVLFYAVAIILAMLHAGGGFNALLAWIYVGLRIAHSLVQALFNEVNLRFALFAAGSVVLFLLALRAALLLFAAPAA